MTEEDVRRQISLALGWGNTPPTDVLVRDIRAKARAMMQLQRELLALYRHVQGTTVDVAELDKAMKTGAILAQVLR